MKEKTLKKITFDDVLIVPRYSEINSRKEVDVSADINGLKLDLPVISANMDTVTEEDMCEAMHKSGGIGCYHRFNIDTKVLPFEKCPFISSIGVGSYSRYLTQKHYQQGQRYFCIDVAHGAQKQVANQFLWVKDKYPNAWIMVGNFASPNSVADFLNPLLDIGVMPNAIKVGVGPGSACTTRIKTGVGYPQLSAISDIADLLDDSADVPKIVADGGIKTPGDIAKALACGADAVMLGGMLAGTDETPGEIMPGKPFNPEQVYSYKVYRGSASKESYEDQNKDWSTAEGEAFTVPYKGPVENILKDIEGGLKSAFSYVGAKNLKEFQEKSEFIIVSTNSVKESRAHGKDQN